MRLRSLFVLSSALCAAPAVHASDCYYLGAVPYSMTIGISDDGKVASGKDPSRVWHWNKDAWVVFLADAVAYGNGVGGIPALNAAGTLMWCSVYDSQDVDTRKTIGAEYDITQNVYTPLVLSASYCGMERYGNWGMGSNANQVCGLIWDSYCSAHGFVENRSTGVMKIMQETYAYKPTRANGVSDDGALVVGWNDDYNGYRQGCVWKRNTDGTYTAKTLNTGNVIQKLPEAYVVSRDGKWAFGAGKDGLNGGQPYRWSPTTGYQALGTLPEAGVPGVTACNHDGSMACVSGLTLEYLWILGRGYVSLPQWCSEHGFALSADWGYALRGMSDDGLSFTGFAIRTVDGVWSPFVIDLHGGQSACPADLNGDLTVNGADLGMLLGAWGTSSYDLNGDAVVNGADLGILLGQWGNCH